MYYNYHGLNKTRIKNGELVDFKIVEEYHKIPNALLLYFENGDIKPIREYRHLEYMILINKYLKRKN